MPSIIIINVFVLVHSCCLWLCLIVVYLSLWLIVCLCFVSRLLLSLFGPWMDPLIWAGTGAVVEPRDSRAVRASSCGRLPSEPCVSVGGSHPTHNIIFKPGKLDCIDVPSFLLILYVYFVFVLLFLFFVVLFLLMFFLLFFLWLFLLLLFSYFSLLQLVVVFLFAFLLFLCLFVQHDVMLFFLLCFLMFLFYCSYSFVFVFFFFFLLLLFVFFFVS